MPEQIVVGAFPAAWACTAPVTPDGGECGCRGDEHMITFNADGSFKGTSCGDAAHSGHKFMVRQA